MSYTKTIVCFANSRKMCGRCLAGKEFDEQKHFGGWVRPVSDRPTQEISEEERWYENGEDPRVLDVIQIRMREPRPHAPQSENHLIDSGYYWARRGRITWNDAEGAVDTVDGLWVDGHSSYNGANDRIPEDVAVNLDSSLLFIRPTNLTIIVAVEGAEFNNPRRKVRARFRFNHNNYVLAVTDPVVERRYLGMENGEYPIETALLCVSIGEPYQGFCYKLVAAVIIPEC